MKKWIWEKSWHGISFQDLDIQITRFKRPTSRFYDQFYKALFQKYVCFDELPSSWRKQKADTARYIAEIITQNAKVLSIGAGIGFVEKEICKVREDIEIDCFDFSSVAGLWLTGVSQIKQIDSLNGHKPFDFILCAQLMYASSDREIGNLCKSIKKVLHSDGVILTIDTSLNNVENGEKEVFGGMLLKQIKCLMSALLVCVSSKRPSQFWGWQRDNHSLIRIFEENALIVEKSFAATGQSFLIFRHR